MNQVLFADDKALVADSQERLKQLVEEFGRVSERRKLRLNENKSKVMKSTWFAVDRKTNVSLNGRLVSEIVEWFKYIVSYCG